MPGMEGRDAHGQVHGRVQAQAALVRPQGRVELHAVAAVDAQAALVVLPGDAELDDALGDGGDLEGGAVLGVLLEEGAVLEGAGELWGASARHPRAQTQGDEDAPL